MRRRRLISLLSLAGLSVLHGCADSSSPQQAASNLTLPATAKKTVVVATHYEPLPTIDLLLNETTVTPTPAVRVRPEHVRRLPPIDSTNVSRPKAVTAPIPYRFFERLPNLGCVSAPAPRPYAIDLSEPQEPSRTPATTTAATTELLPSIVKIVTEKEEVREPVVPKKRFVEAKAPKPPLTPLVSHVAAAPSGSAGWLMTGTSLVAVSQRADAVIDRGFVLGGKGAYYSAQTEFKQALRIVSQAMDAHFGGNHYSESLAAGWVALEEASDFSAHGQRDPIVNVPLIVESHQTPALKDYALDDVSPVVAMQHYFSFAQDKLVEACGKAPVASRALHGLGKIHMVLAEKSASAERLHGPKAMAFQQAALTTDPTNYLAANELGVLLARFGKLPEARTVLQHSVALYPQPETWRNLSIVHERLGEANYAAQSLANWQIALQQSGNQPAAMQTNNSSMVQWVTPQAFAGDQPELSNAPAMPESATPPEQPAQAQKKSGFLWW